MNKEDISSKQAYIPSFHCFFEETVLIFEINNLIY